VQRARQLRRTGLTLSAGAVAAAGAVAIAGGVQVHPPEWLPAAVFAPPVAAAAGVLGAKAALGDELWIEWHCGSLHVERIPRRTGGRIQPGDVVVTRNAQRARLLSAYMPCVCFGTCRLHQRMWLVFIASRGGLSTYEAD
jgi:hypothetical protein